MIITINNKVTHSIKHIMNQPGIGLSLESVYNQIVLLYSFIFQFFKLPAGLSHSSETSIARFPLYWSRFCLLKQCPKEGHRLTRKITL